MTPCSSKWGPLGPELVYVRAVHPDSANDRTRVEVRRISDAGLKTEAVRSTALHFSQVEDFNVSADTAMTKRVRAVLDEVSRVAEQGDAAALAAHLENVALPQLETEAQTARDGNFTKLLPWVESLLAELKAELGMLAAAQPAMAQPTATPGVDTTTGGNAPIGILGAMVKSLSVPPSIPPASAKQLPRDVKAVYAAGMDTIPRLLATVQPALAGTLYASWKNIPPSSGTSLEVHALRVVAAPFGHNAPLRLIGIDEQNGKRPVMAEWRIDDPFNLTKADADDKGTGSIAATPAVPGPDHHRPLTLYLDNDYDITPDSFIAIQVANQTPIVTTAQSIKRSLSAYGLSGKTVELNLPEKVPWLTEASRFDTVRKTRVYAGAEKLPLAEMPIADDVAGIEIELGDLYGGLQPGRWLIVAGERSDILANEQPVSGVKAAELVMIAAVEQKTRLIDNAVWPGDKVHTFITLAEKLAYKYKRDTVTIYGNVVRATNGETRREVLGGGDASKALQTFTLKQAPLTFVSAPTVSGVNTTLEVRVNDVRWHETEMFAALAPQDRKYVTRTDDDAKTSVVFGDGEHGLRLPTGAENVKATYRSGIGKAGNVKAGQLSSAGHAAARRQGGDRTRSARRAAPTRKAVTRPATTRRSP